MFLHRSMKWPSPPAFFSKFLRSSKGTPSHPESSPQKPRQWTFPVIPLPSISTLQSYLPSMRNRDKTKPTIHSNIESEHFQICINLVHHIIDVCASGCLWLFSPVFRITLDVFGIQGALQLWIHGLAVFLATTYGMYLLLWLAQEYIFQLTSLYVVLQTLVLIVSLKGEREDEKGKEEAIEFESEKKEEEDVEEEEIQHGEDRWAGGSEDEGNSQDEWESEGEEEVGHA
ncbi:uncharacterized protein C6orf47 homolog [Rana temporaria]|uniref:uncharacterized protein C6orf47 homolog n=1 Tax=Rana temporaria TaxID=8407 RepID=UPI001AACAD9E|nr:uncharacterized protein C6orf47 homolog [Rana temporaria]XP_040179026.1 uncharacterized protein C6orf47 homolog [Rana temporaria]XP_040179027.1 uncharacterized protein C6orf47 homolog [Rana temporaria]